MSTIIEYRYITRKDDILGGEPIIKGTRIPLRAIVELWRMGTSPEEICMHLPPLRLAQIFEALSYYDDNPNEINKHIERNRIPDELIDPLVQDSE